jgi:hypothetical protein
LDPARLYQSRDDILAALREHEIYDGALYFHGFRDYMRDYEIVVANDFGGPSHGTHAYLFRFCTEAHLVSMLPTEVWKASTDDRLLGSPGGMVTGPYELHWGIRFSMIQSEWEWVRSSERAQRWSEGTRRDFIEVAVQTNEFRLELTFAELAVTRISEDIIDIVKNPMDPLVGLR